MTSVVAINLVFRYLFNPEYGLINGILGATVPWYSNGWLIKIAIIIKNTWSGMGGAMILCLAGMLAIPASYYEAADIDGASAARKFFKITRAAHHADNVLHAYHGRNRRFAVVR